MLNINVKQKSKHKWQLLLISGCQYCRYIRVVHHDKLSFFFPKKKPEQINELPAAQKICHTYTEHVLDSEIKEDYKLDLK